MTSAAPTGNTLFVVGDSISMHYGPYLAQYLPTGIAYARKGMGDGFGTADDLDHPSGEDANGGDSSMVLAYLQQRFGAPNFRPTWLLLNAGLHDLRTDPATGAKQVELDDYRANLSAILELATVHDTPLIWVRTTPVIEAIHNAREMGFQRLEVDVDAYNAAADAIFEAAGCPLLDLHGFTARLGGAAVFADHVHFTDLVCQLQAAYLAGALAHLLVV